MDFFIKAFHIFISIVMVFVVLLQSGKGASMGAAFGGTSSNALFGATGSNTLMTKLTTFVAVLFIITCLTLAYMSSHMATSSLMSDVQTEAPAGVPIEAVPGMPAGEIPPPPLDAATEAPATLPPLEKSVPAQGTDAPITDSSQH